MELTTGTGRLNLHPLYMRNVDSDEFLVVWNGGELLPARNEPSKRIIGEDVSGAAMKTVGQVMRTKEWKERK